MQKQNTRKTLLDKIPNLVGEPMFAKQRCNAKELQEVTDYLDATGDDSDGSHIASLMMMTMQPMSYMRQREPCIASRSE